jgi:hypothetical protein
MSDADSSPVLASAAPITIGVEEFPFPVAAALEVLATLVVLLLLLLLLLLPHPATRIAAAARAPMLPLITAFIPYRPF